MAKLVIFASQTNGPIMMPYLLPHASVYASNKRLLKFVNSGDISLAGNKMLKIYGTLDCRSGKRMKALNRVLFRDAQDALDQGFRACGHCMRNEYLLWKNQQVK